MASTKQLTLFILILSLAVLPADCVFRKGIQTFLKDTSNIGYKVARNDMNMFQKINYSELANNGNKAPKNYGRPNEFVNEYGENIYEQQQARRAEMNFGEMAPKRFMENNMKMNEGLMNKQMQNNMQVVRRNMEFQFDQMKEMRENLGPKEFGRGNMNQAEGEMGGRGGKGDVLMQNVREADLLKAKLMGELQIKQTQPPKGGNLNVNLIGEGAGKGGNHAELQPKTGNIVEGQVKGQAESAPKEKVNFKVEVNYGRGNQGPKAENQPAEVKAEIKDIQIAEQGKTDLVVQEQGRTDLVVQQQNGGNNLMVIKGQPKDIQVVKSEPKDIQVIKAEPKDLQVVKSEPKDIQVVKAEPKDVIVNPNQSVEVVEFEVARNDLAEIKPQETQLTVVNPQVTDLVTVKPQVTDLTVIKPQVTDLTVIKPQVTDLTVIKPQTTDLVTVKPQVTDLTVIKQGENQLIKVEPQTTDLALVRPNPAELILNKPAQGLPKGPLNANPFTLARMGRMPYNPNFGLNQGLFTNFGRSPMFGTRPFVNIKPEGGTLGELNTGVGRTGRTGHKEVESDGGKAKVAENNAEAFDPHVRMGLRRGLNFGMRLPAKGKWLDLMNQDKSIDFRPSMVPLNTMSMSNPMFFHPLLYRTNIASIMKELRLDAPESKPKQVGGYSLSDEEFDRFAVTYTGAKAQLNTQFNLPADIMSANRELVTDLRTKLVDRADEIHKVVSNIDTADLYDLYKEKKLPLGHSVQVFANLKAGIYEELDGTDDYTRLLWERIYNEHRLVKDSEPMTKFKEIYYDSEAITDQIKRSGDPNWETTKKALWNARLEYLFTPVPITFDHDILLDLPMYNYVLNIEEACIETFAVEICDDITTDLHRAYTKMGPIVRRDYEMVEVLSAMVIKKKNADVYQFLVEQGIMDGFKKFSQHMMDRIEFMLLSYVPVRK